MDTHTDEPEAAMALEWHLDVTAEPAEPYNFTNVNPKLVFVLALLAALVAVSGVLCAYLLIRSSIDAGIIPEPPSLRSNVY